MKKTWYIPVTYEEAAIATVEADTLAEAIDAVNDGDYLTLSKNGYVADSLAVSVDDPDYIREFYNQNQPDAHIITYPPASMRVKKIVDKPVEAWELGIDSPMYRKMVHEGKIIPCDGGYELRSSEVADSNAHGELACDGDFFKVDGHGNPYPNERKWFLENHYVGDDGKFYQKAVEMKAWSEADSEICEEVMWLMMHDILKRNVLSTEARWSASLYGTEQTAAADAYILLREVSRVNGEITKVDFAFVTREEFNRTYEIIGEEK